LWLSDAEEGGYLLQNLQGSWPKNAFKEGEKQKRRVTPEGVVVTPEKLRLVSKGIRGAPQLGHTLRIELMETLSEVARS